MKIDAADTYVFEQWLLQTHPKLFAEWELEASEWLDLDEWLDREYYHVLDEWNKFRSANPILSPAPPSPPNQRL